MHSRVYLALLLAVALLAVGVVAHATSITLEADNNRVAPHVAFAVHVNMTENVALNAGTFAVVSLNVTIPDGFSVAYALITYTDNSGAYTAQPLNITWDAAARNLTIYVNVSNVGGTTTVYYNDLNVTLIMVALSSTASGYIKAEYAENGTAVAGSAAEALLEVNATVAPVGFTAGFAPSFSVSSTPFIIAGPVSLEYTLKLLNTTSLPDAYINETLFSSGYIRVCMNSSYTASIESLYTPTSVQATFGSNTTSITINGLIMRLRGLSVTGELKMPSQDYYTMAVVDGASVSGTLEINVSQAAVVAGVEAGTLKLNTSSLGLVYATTVTSGYVNATANNVEVGLLNVNASSSLEFTNASGVTGDEAYLGLVNAPSLTADSAWSVYAYLSKISQATGSVEQYGSSLYDMITSRETSVVVNNLPQPATGDINVTLEAGLNLANWVSGAVSVPEFREVLVYTGVTPEATALVLLPFQNSAQWSYTESFAAPMTVVAVNMTASTARYLAGEATSTSVTLNTTTPFTVIMWAPVRTTEVSSTTLEYGYGVGLINITIAPSLLVTNTIYNASVTLGLSGAKFVGYVAWFDNFLPVQQYRANEAGGEVNVSLNVFTPEYVSAPVYHGIKVGIVVMAPNVTGSYQVNGNIVAEGYGLVEEPASTTLTIREYAAKDAAYIASSPALGVYLGVFAGNEYAPSTTGMLVWYNESAASQVFGKILLTSTSYDIRPYLTEAIVRYTPADRKFALIGMAGIATVEMPTLNITVPLTKVCLVNVKLMTSNLVINSTSGYTGTVMLSNAELGEDTAPLTYVGLNVTAMAASGSKLYAQEAYVNLTTGVFMSGTLNVSGTLVVRHGELAVFYATVNIGSVNELDNGILKIYSPMAAEGAAANYVVERLMNAEVWTGPFYAMVSAATTSVNAVTDYITVSFTSTPSTPTFVVAYNLIPMIPGAPKGYAKAYDIAVVGATPSMVELNLSIPPDYCVIYNTPQKLASIVNVYYYNGAAWVKTSSYAITADTKACRITLAFDSTTLPKASSFTGLPVAIALPPAIVRVGLKDFKPLNIVSPADLLPVYAALAAILAASLAAFYLGARRA